MPGSLQSIERAAAIMRLLAASPRALGVAQISSALGLAKGTTHGLLKTLLSVGFVIQHADSRYAPAPGLERVGLGPVDPNHLRSLTMNFADGLASRSGCPVRVGMLEWTEVRVVHHVFGPTEGPELTLDVDSTYPAHACALGKILLASRVGGLPGEAVLESRTPRTIVDPYALESELTRFRSQGWAVADAELRPGFADLAAPIRSAGGSVIGSIGVAGPSERLLIRGAPRARMVTLVIESAAAISAAAHSSSWSVISR